MLVSMKGKALKAKFNPVRGIAWVVIFVLFACVAQRGFAQTDGPNDPASALRDAVIAACKQDSAEFNRALTTRNAEAFQHMTPAARATFLKRFVLLDKQGQPGTNADANGFSVYCATSDVTTQMKIGKPELRDNIAFLPFSVKDSTDTTDASLRRVTMGMVRESGQWKLLSLGLLLLDLPSLGEEWDRAEIKSNELSAVANIKKLSEAIETYRKSYTRLPDSLGALGGVPAGTAKSDKAGLLENDLAAGRKDGYVFRFVVVGANTSGAPAKYELAGIPAEYGRTGLHSFFLDSSGALHSADHQGSIGSALDPKFEIAAAATTPPTSSPSTPAPSTPAPSTSSPQ
jgi:hypothetical protein